MEGAPLPAGGCPPGGLPGAASGSGSRGLLGAADELGLAVDVENDAERRRQVEAVVFADAVEVEDHADGLGPPLADADALQVAGGDADLVHLLAGITQGEAAVLQVEEKAAAFAALEHLVGDFDLAAQVEDHARILGIGIVADVLQPHRPPGRQDPGGGQGQQDRRYAFDHGDNLQEIGRKINK